MGIVTLVGVLVVTVDVGVDIVYCTYYGLMTFVSGLMDFGFVLEKTAWHRDTKGLQRPAEHFSLHAMA